MRDSRLSSIKNHPMWEQAVSKGLERSIANLSKMSGSRWDIPSPRISWSSVEELAKAYKPDEETGAGIHFQIDGEIPFTAMLVFPPGDVRMISECFMGHSYVRLSRLNQAEELAVAELGNIIVNAFVGAMANTIRKILLPSVPRCIQGTRVALMEALQATVAGKGHEVCVMALMLSGGAGNAASELLSIFSSDSMARLSGILSENGIS